MTSPRPIHPFPARMAPEIALAECRTARAGSILLDPMVGSGTSLRIASDSGLSAIGFDLDPLAVLISRVWTRKLSAAAIERVAREVLQEARSAPDMELPWIDGDANTAAFVNFWFAPRQKSELRRLARALSSRVGPAADACRVALSRAIITKDRGASKARDASHSRPHVVYRDEDFDVFDGFAKSAARVAQILDSAPPSGTAHVRRGDARQLGAVPDESVDLVVTSPPYLNAIDYMRGHRLSLVWLGYSLSELAAVRSTAIGTERGGGDTGDVANTILSGMDLTPLSRRFRSMVERYASDVNAMVAEVARCLRFRGTAVFVVGDSCLKGCYVENANIVSSAAALHGLSIVSRFDRQLPAAKRYLPPPTPKLKSSLDGRMRFETVLKLAKHPSRQRRRARADSTTS